MFISWLESLIKDFCEPLKALGSGKTFDFISELLMESSDLNLFGVDIFICLAL